ncbi:hypothetical protein MBLNU457_7753t1 [Dothideomycetes sp. NU457]
MAEQTEDIRPSIEHSLVQYYIYLSTSTPTEINHVRASLARVFQVVWEITRIRVREYLDQAHAGRLNTYVLLCPGPIEEAHRITIDVPNPCFQLCLDYDTGLAERILPIIARLPYVDEVTVFQRAVFFRGTG